MRKEYADLTLTTGLRLDLSVDVGTQDPRVYPGQNSQVIIFPLAELDRVLQYLQQANDVLSVPDSDARQ